MKKLEEYFENNINISHSFIIANTSLDRIGDQIQNIISNYIFGEKTNIHNDPDIYIIKTENNTINKDEILEMHQEIEKTSVIHGKKIYIIDEAEKLNSYASNSLLKFLEEPAENTYAFLITTNINAVISTIRSRCQEIFISSEACGRFLSSIEKEELEIVIKFIKELEANKTKIIKNYKYFIEFDREKTIKMFMIMLYIYIDALNKNTDKELQYFEDNNVFQFIINKNSFNEITRKIKIINDIIEKLNYNLNINLLIDRFIIIFGGDVND